MNEVTQEQKKWAKMNKSKLKLEQAKGMHVAQGIMQLTHDVMTGSRWIPILSLQILLTTQKS